MPVHWLSSFLAVPHPADGEKISVLSFFKHCHRMCCQALHGFVLYTSGVLFVDVYGFTSCRMNLSLLILFTLQVKLVVSNCSLNGLFDVVRFVAFVAFLVSTITT